MIKRSTDKILFFKNDITYTNMIELWYPIDNDKEHIALRSILPDLIMGTSQEFPEENMMERAYMKHYILKVGKEIVKVGTQKFLFFRLEVPQKRKVREFDFASSIELFLNNIYHPYVDDTGFVKFDEKLELLKKEMQHIKKDKKESTTKELLSLLDQDGSLTRGLYYHQEQLDTLTSKETYEYYYHAIHDNKPFIFLFGNEELLEAQTILESYFSAYPNVTISLEKDFHFLKRNKTIKEVEVKKQYRESLLYLVYKIEDMKEEDRIFVQIVANMLSSNVSRWLFNKLRIQEKLVYSASCSSFSKYGMFIIGCGIHQKNKNKSIEKVKEIFEELNDIDKISSILNRLREDDECYLIRYLDWKYNMFDEQTTQYFGIEETTEKLINQVQTVTPKQVQEFLNRIKLDFIYFLKGEEDAE